MDLQDLHQEITLIKSLQGLRDDIDEDLNNMRTKNQGSFLYDFDYYTSKKDALSFVINEHLNSADELAAELVNKELKANVNN